MNLRSFQTRTVQKLIWRAGLWICAWLMVFVSSSFALRDPITLEVSLLRAINFIDTTTHQHNAQARAQQKSELHQYVTEHVQHVHVDCLLCFAPVLASGAPNGLSIRAPNLVLHECLNNPEVLQVKSEQHGHVQARAPPFFTA